MATYLGCQIARARVLGFQGEQLGGTDAVMACAKHFAAYGAAIAGRDYNAVDMSEQQLWEVYLPPFKAAFDAGALSASINRAMRRGASMCRHYLNLERM